MQTSFSITAILLSVIYLLYFIFRKGRKAIPLPLVAVVLSAAALELFDLLTLLYPDDLFFWKKFSLAIESSFPPIWFWFTLTYARQIEISSISLFQRLLFAASPIFAVFVFLFPVTSFFYSPDFDSEKVLFLGNVGFIFYLMLLIYLIIPLVNLEMTLKNASYLSRWKIKIRASRRRAVIGRDDFLLQSGATFPNHQHEPRPGQDCAPHRSGGDDGIFPSDAGKRGQCICITTDII